VVFVLHIETRVYSHQLDRISAVCSEGPELAALHQNTADEDCPHLRSAHTAEEGPDLFLSSSLTTVAACPKDVLLALISRSLQPTVTEGGMWCSMECDHLIASILGGEQRGKW